MPNSNLNFGPYLFTYTTTGNCPYIESFWVSSSCATTALTTLTDNFKIYPNPTFDGFINIETDLDMNTEIEIYNLIGAKVQTQSIKLIPGKNIIRLREDLAKADYLLFVNLGKEKRMFRISYR
jgi:hypothetical protein